VIRIINLNAGLSNPLLDNWEIAMVKCGVSKRLGCPPIQKLPITIEILLIFCDMYSLLDFDKVRDLSFWAASLICFYGLLRKNTLLPPILCSVSKAFLIRSDVVEVSRHSFF
jgi:hypothetical protein